MPPDPILIEGYASVFGREDLGGDIVRAGAFAASLARGGVACLIGHRETARAGRWVHLREDGRGLFVRGLIEAAPAIRLIEEGVRGLSIGFFPKAWMPRREGGRLLTGIDLVEISIVRTPMQTAARFEVAGPAMARAA
jgi:uncharacterized protein